MSGLPSDFSFDLPEKFTNPFRYFPHPLVVRAASEVISHIDTSEDLRAAFSEGKMLGILLCTFPNSPTVIPNLIWDLPARENQPWGSKGKEEGKCLPALHGWFSRRAHVIQTLSAEAIPGAPQHVIPHLMRDPLSDTSIGYLAAFSGSVGGKSYIEGFVPPIFDLMAPSGYFKVKEAEISEINLQIKALEKSSGLSSLRSELAEAEKLRDKEIAEIKLRMAESKRKRDELRGKLNSMSGVAVQGKLESLVRESQFEKAELRRLKMAWEDKTSLLKRTINSIKSGIEELKKLRAGMSDELQEWIFKQYIVHNSLGEESSIFDIFAAQGLVPPGGTGDCAAPKLLEYAFRNGLKPVAMGEFWYGKSPDTAVRTDGHFYPSCTSKCGPLLGFMMRGMEISDDTGHAGCAAGGSCRTTADQKGIKGQGGTACLNGEELEIIYEDEVLIAVNKASGMPSVPGLDGRKSAFEFLRKTFGELFTVHRLDMDTSGVLLFAKTAEAAVYIQKQFENHTIRKTYLARLSAGGIKPLKAGAKGRIELPLSPDYDERPRQKVDFKQGKAALTDYEVKVLNEDGTIDILFSPLTGRTHQLRVHAAHSLGLNRPILGDPLYGGSPVPRLHLHASSIIFRHPSTHKEMSIPPSVCSFPI